MRILVTSLLCFFVMVAAITLGEMTMRYGGLRRLLSTTDFRAFYTAGAMVRRGFGEDLYDLRLQTTWQRKLFGDRGIMPFVNAPFSVLLILLPSGLDFLRGYGLWMIVNLTLLTLAGMWVIRRLDRVSKAERFYVLAGLLSFFPVWVCLIQGQWSLWLLISLILGIENINQGRDFWGGMGFALLLIKPHLLLVPLLILAWRRKIKAVVGLMAGMVILIAVSGGIVGWRGLIKFGELLGEVKNWSYVLTVNPTRMYSWEGWVESVFGFLGKPAGDLLWMGGAGLGLVFGFWITGKSKCSEKGFAVWGWVMMILLMIFTSYHLGYHDLSLLVAAGGLITRINWKWLIWPYIGTMCLGGIVPIWGLLMLFFIWGVGKRIGEVEGGHLEE